jgi:hypothetical protein
MQDPSVQHPEKRMLTPAIESAPPPVPKREPPENPNPGMEYAFHLIPVGGAGRFPRSIFTVRKKMYEYQKAHPKTKFIARAISPSSTRVWRIK